MSVKSYLLIVFHLLPWALGMGSAFYFAFIAVPLANRLLEGEKRLEFIRWNIKYYSPFFLLMMSIVVVTGAWRLTDYKIVLGIQYFQDVSTVLIVKLILFMVIYLLAAYQSFGLGLRVTGQGKEAMADSVAAGVVDTVFKKMRTIAIINLVLMSVTVYVGLKLSRIPYFKATGQTREPVTELSLPPASKGQVGQVNLP